MNAFIEFKMKNPRTKHLGQLQFRRNLARQLINGFSSRNKKGHFSEQSVELGVPDEVRRVIVGVIRYNLQICEDAVGIVVK